MSSDFDELDYGQTIRGDEKPLLGNRYRVVRELGHGGMGSVYLAEDTHLDGRRVAIKMPSAILAKNKRALNDLKREAMVALTLSHPAIASLRGFEQTDDGVFLVMDYIDGQTLEDLLADRGTIPPDEAVALLLPIAQALDYAHEKKVIHRDLKPSNILIDQQGRPYLTDFGIAREVKDTLTRVTGRADTSGTLPYMSPEQLEGHNPTPEQDIYSFGALIYECLVGNPPFFRGKIEHQIMHTEPDAQRLRAVPGISIALVSSVLRCLSKKSDLRLATATDVLDTDSQGAGGHQRASSPPSASPASPPRGESAFNAGGFGQPAFPEHTHNAGPPMQPQPLQQPAPVQYPQHPPQAYPQGGQMPGQPPQYQAGHDPIQRMRQRAAQTFDNPMPAEVGHAAFWTGLLSIFFFWTIIGGFVLGIYAIRKGASIKKEVRWKNINVNDGRATGGMAMGWIGVILSGFFFLASIAN